jgi:hypothetical protein
MLIYRFRITCEEHDGFLREIEIQPNQTFLDFHHILMESADLLHCERASFFNTDKKYVKDREISLKPEKRMFRKYDEDLDQVVSESRSLPLMKNEKLKNYIEDPHQKMIYEFFGRDIFSFHIELFKIFPSDGITSFPRYTKRIGDLPKKAEQPSPEIILPVTPKVVVPPISFPKIEDLLKLDHLVEDESELAAIENELDALVEEHADEPAFESTGSDTGGIDDFLYEEQGGSEDDETLDQLEDYEDIDSLDKRLSGFDHDSEDY